MTINFLTLIVLALAVYRLTHLVVFDKIFEPIRNLFVIRDFYYMQFWLQGGKLRRLIGSIMICPWCTGLWVSALIVIGYHYFSSVTYWICLLLALAAIQSLIETAWMKFVGYPEMKPGTQQKEEKH